MLTKYIFSISLSVSLLAGVVSAQQTAEEQAIEKNDQESEQATEKITLKDLEGTWNVESIEFDGQKAPPQAGAPEVFKMSEGVLNTLTGGKRLETFSDLRMAIKEADPMQLDLIRGQEGEQGTLPCIFKIEEDRLVIAMPMVPTKDGPDMETARPKGFDTSDGQFLVLTAIKKTE